MEQLICEAILTGNIVAAVELCMAAGRTSDAIILASGEFQLSFSIVLGLFTIKFILTFL